MQCNIHMHGWWAADSQYHGVHLQIIWSPQLTQYTKLSSPIMSEREYGFNHTLNQEMNHDGLAAGVTFHTFNLKLYHP